MKHGKQGDPPMIFGGYFTGTEGPGRILEFNDVAWRVEQAEQDPANPLLKPKFPWDNSAVCMGHGTVLKDPIDNRFKAWLVSLESGNACNEPFKYRLTYASSDDGVNWERPALDMCPWPGYDGTNSGAAAGAAHFIFDSVSQTLYFDTDSATDGYQTVASVQSGGSVAAGDIEIINPGPLWKIQAALTPYGVPGAADPFSEGAGAAAHRPGAGQNVQPVKAAGLENNCRRRSDPKAHPLKRRPGPGHMNGMGDEINCLDSCLV